MMQSTLGNINGMSKDKLRTLLRVSWKWPVSDIRRKRGQPFSDCKYRGKFSVAKQLQSVESKGFCMRNKSKRI